MLDYRQLGIRLYLLSLHYDEQAAALLFFTAYSLGSLATTGIVMDIA